MSEVPETEDAEDADTDQFSRKYPRFRIDLTTVTVADNKKDNIPFLGNFMASRSRDQLKKEYGDRIEFLDNVKDDLETLACLWNEASRAAGGQSIVCAFPNASRRVVRQWVDLFDWIQENCEDWNPNMEATYEDKFGMPTVAITSPPTSNNRRRRKSSAVLGTKDVTLVERQQKSWVKRILVDKGICPFTKSTKLSGQGLSDVGMPVARIAYHTSYATDLVELMADAWTAILEMVRAGPKGKTGVSSILLAAPAFDDNLDDWLPVFALLEAGVMVAGLEEHIGVVCFHPKYATPDGSTFPGFGHMHSVPRLQDWVRQRSSSNDFLSGLSTEDIAAGGAWQRRTPHATINVLRADQLQAAEGRRNTPQLYAENIRTLMEIGNDQLALDLEKEQTMGLE